MMCRTCGKFGHYIEGCPEKKNVNQGGKENPQHQGVRSADVRSDQDKNSQETMQGPWVVVQKPRRPRKNSGGTGGNTGNSKTADSNAAGTRFQILGSINDEETIPTKMGPLAAVNAEIEQQHVKHNKSQKGKNQPATPAVIKRSNDERKNETRTAFNGESISIKKKKIETVNKGNHGKIIEIEEDVMETDMVTTERVNKDMSATQKHHNDEFESHNNDAMSKHGTRPPDKLIMGQKIISIPNVTRPPDMLHAPHSSSSIPVSLPGKETMDNEVFIDANDQGVVELADSEMEIVNETQKLG
jgi:hypothetical protein